VTPGFGGRPGGGQCHKRKGCPGSVFAGRSAK